MNVGVVGLGYVGLPLAVAFARSGSSVVAVDADDRKVQALQAGSSYVEDISDEALRECGERLSPTTSFQPLSDVEAIFVCVPTPLTPNREPDLSALQASSDELADILRPGHLVVYESTTYPGTTREMARPILERGGLVAGSDFNLAFSPERIDPGRQDWTLETTPKVVGGLTAECTERAVSAYEQVCTTVVPVSTPEVAELSKLLENVFRSVNIALVNELWMICDRMGIDVREVVDAASTKPYGFMRFDPGPGMGGHCLPVDPFYLSWRARQFDISAEFIELAGKVNQQMPSYGVEKVRLKLNDRGLASRGAKVAVLGVSYKPGVGDVRESPALKMITLLRGLGAEVVYHDPYVQRLGELEVDSLGWDEALEGADAVVLVTAHPDFAYEQLLGDDRVVDLRGALRALPVGGRRGE